MSRPDPRRQAAAVAASAAFAGAVDLSALKARATAPPTPTGPTDPAADGPVAAGGASPFVIEITEASFGQVVQASSQVLVVVELWDSRSDRAAQLSPALEKLVATAGGSWILARADIAT